MHLLLLAGFLLAPLAAQTTVAVTAATPIAALTAAAAGPTTFQGVPQGQPIGTSPNQLFLTTSQSPPNTYLSATTICYPTLPYQGGIGINFFERAYARGTASDLAGSSASPAQAGATFGPHAVLATFSAPPGTVGRIVVSFRRSSSNGGSASTAIDVGNDGTVEFASVTAADWSLPCTIGPSGQVTVRAGNECRSAGNGTSTTVYTWTELYVAFRPDLTATCTITSYGQGCSGVQAAGTELVVGTTRTVIVLATGCFPNSPAIVATGSQQLGLQLPGGCSLLCNAEGIALALADAAGNATQTWSIPVTVVGTTYVQFLPIADVNGALVIRASNGVRVACTR
ncbi:MAG: hypothetical protein FJ265_04740 [Planctomycetes bacterium]|nr:hypothetical protein [Planctomycetota bacterium]